MTSSQIRNNRLSIRCFADGFSFYVPQNIGEVRLLQSEQQKEHRLTDEVLKGLAVTFPDHLPEIQIIVHSKAFRLVPNQLFSTKDAAAFLSLFPAANIIPKLRIEKDDVPDLGCVNVYFTFRWVEMLMKKLSEMNAIFAVEHDITSLINANSSKPKGFDPHVSVFVNKKEISVSAQQRNSLLLANKFSYSTTEDVVYHVLNCCKQLNLSTETTKVHLAGEVELHAIKTLLSNYMIV